MTKKAETDYTVKVNGMPNYANIPKAVLEPISKGAFRDCSKLTSITIPDGVTRIDSSVFANCSGLTSVTIYRIA